MMYESYRAYSRISEERRSHYMKTMISKLKLAREYISYKRIHNTYAFDLDIPWPKELRYDILKIAVANINQINTINVSVNVYLILQKTSSLINLSYFLQAPRSWPRRSSSLSTTP